MNSQEKKLSNMKYKKQLQWLKCKQDWYDKQDRQFQAANKRPGSVKTK